jgi:hypothetical protein
VFQPRVLDDLVEGGQHKNTLIFNL